MIISEEIKKLVAGATFKIHSRDRGKGLCVLIEGDLVITASHCANWDSTGNMVTNGEGYLNNIKTKVGDFLATTLAVEAVSDIAVLGSPDPQNYYYESVAFDESCEPVIPVKLLKNIPNLKLGERFPVWVWTHRESWVAGTATYFLGNSTFSFDTESEIPNGSSGGPVVNHAGELIGIVSHCTSAPSQGIFTSAAGFLPMALPAWVIARSTPNED